MKALFAKILKRDRIVIRKSDNEMVRYAKHVLKNQNTMITNKHENEEKRILESKSADLK